MPSHKWRQHIRCVANSVFRQHCHLLGQIGNCCRSRHANHVTRYVNELFTFFTSTRIIHITRPRRLTTKSTQAKLNHVSYESGLNFRREFRVSYGTVDNECRFLVFTLAVGFEELLLSVHPVLNDEMRNFRRYLF